MCVILRLSAVTSEVVAQLQLMQYGFLSLLFLTSRGVSPLLAASLIHAAVNEVLQTDLTEFKQQNVETEGEGDEERFTCKYAFFFLWFSQRLSVGRFPCFEMFPRIFG